MAVILVPVCDAIGANVSRLPAGQAAGYTTGSGGVAWTAAQFAARPGTIRICQDTTASDHTADVLDVETGAASPAQCPGWYRAALASYTTGTRPGQRYPCIYCNLSALPAAANALTAAGIRAGPCLWLADWNVNEAGAAALVTFGQVTPYPVAGVQYSNTGGGGVYDLSVFSTGWLEQVSGKAPAPPPPAPPAVTAPVKWLLPVLSQGSPDVAGVCTLQRLLQGRPGPAVAIDGSFGPATAAAVRALQAGAKIAQDGVVGVLTWAVLAGM